MRPFKEKYADAIINLLLFLYPLFLIGYIGFASFRSFSWDVLNSNNILENIFHFVEIFFIAPIPIFILTALQKYLKTIAFNTIEVENRIRLSSLTQSLLETNLTKYNFISVILSTFFIGIIEKVIIDKDAAEHFRNNLYYILALAITIIVMIILFFYLKSSKHNITDLIKEANKANELSITTNAERKESLSNLRNKEADRKLMEIKKTTESVQQLRAEVKELEDMKKELSAEITKLRNDTSLNKSNDVVS